CKRSGGTFATFLTSQSCLRQASSPEKESQNSQHAWMVCFLAWITLVLGKNTEKYCPESDVLYKIFKPY
ncbi:MAG: hypothetical protein ACI4JQ_07340, partial [Ruminococcus sp.]